MTWEVLQYIIKFLVNYPNRVFNLQIKKYDLKKSIKLEPVHNLEMQKRDQKNKALFSCKKSLNIRQKLN